MKKIYLFFSILTITLSNSQQTQNNSCATTGGQQLAMAKIQQLANPQVYDATTKYVLNVRFTMVNDDNGDNYCNSNGISFGENDYLNIIRDLNVNFNQFNIFFKYLGHTSINNSTLFQFHGGTLPPLYQSDFNSQTDALTDLSEKDAINIYFVQQITNPSQTPTPTASYQLVFGEAHFGRPIIVLSLPSYVGQFPYGSGNCISDALMAKDFLVCHEMGHVLGLQHVWENWDNTQTSNPYTLAEHVTRDPLQSNYNADHAGDFVADTPVTRNNLFNIHYTNDCKLSNYDSASFPMRDVEGTLFDFNNIEYGNFMSYVYIFNNNPLCNLPCYTNPTFTAGQGIAMRTFLQDIPTAYLSYGTTGYTSTCLNYTRNNINSLFQPYQRTNISGDVVINTTDNGNGTARVCHNILAEDKFQPGFSYFFPSNEAPDTINAGINEIPTVSHHTAGYPVTIYQLDLTDQSINTGLANLICTRGVICQDEPFKNGTLYSSSTLLSMNITVEELNQIQVKDPEFYDKLMKEYYYRLEKETVSGAKVEKVFYKP